MNGTIMTRVRTGTQSSNLTDTQFQRESDVDVDAFGDKFFKE